MFESLTELFKKNYAPLLIVVFFLSLTAVIQFFNGADLAMFQPNHPVTRDFSSSYGGFFGSELDANHPYGGLHKCDYYGSCLYMINSVSLDYMKNIVLLVIFMFAVVAGLKKTKKDKLLTIVYVLISYLLFTYVHSIDWFFHGCTDFCGFEYLFLWLPLLGLFILTVVAKKVGVWLGKS